MSSLLLSQYCAFLVQVDDLSSSHPPLPVTLVPNPTFSSGPGTKVSPTHVHDAGGETQQAAVSIGPVHPGSRGGQTVLLIGTSEQVERSILQVSRLLDKLGINYKVGSSCRGQKSEFTLQSLPNKYKHSDAFAAFGLTFYTSNSCSPAVSSSGTVDVCVSAALLDRHLSTDAVSSTQHHLSSV